jgi:hypothetical protein
MAGIKCPWEKIDKFVSPGELNRFLKWMEEQIAEARAIELEPPFGQQIINGERWFKHIASDAAWRLVPADGPMSPGFWPVKT